MSEQDPLLKIRFDGESVGAGRIPVDQLLVFLEFFNKALQRTGRVLSGDPASLVRGPQPRSIRNEISFDLVLLTHGSPSAVLGFERRQISRSFPELDFGLEILERSLVGLEKAQSADEHLPPGFDSGVLMAWRDAGILFRKGVSNIEFTLNYRERPLVTNFTPQGCEQIRERIKKPTTNIRTIEGRLLMADFKEHGTRCRVHPSVGEPVLCLFDVDQRDEVLGDILHYVRITGEAKEDPATGKISAIQIHDIERLEGKEEIADELLPQGTPITASFWDSPSIDQLAAAQDVGVLRDVQMIFGTWPGDEDDDFEVSIDELRHSPVEIGGIT